ncbi:MAG: RDD family protein, partial [bacterium]
MDFGIILMPFIGSAFVVGFAEGLSGRTLIDTAIGDQVAIIFVLISLVFAWPYSVFLESSSMQGTLGKLALGIRVTD